jgi:CRISPR-associated endoribonuclease Cas6
MIQKVIFRVQAVKGGLINGTGGTELHASFLQGVRHYDPAFSEILHEDREKPFSLGPLVGEMNMQEGKWLLETGKWYSFSLASLNQSIYEILPQMVEFWTNKPLRLGQAEFILYEAKFVVPGGISYSSIVEKSREVEKFSLEFLSPTAFKSKGKYLLFPEFEQVYRSLATTWHSFSNAPLGASNLKGVEVVKYKLKTVLGKFDSYQVPGFIGNCQYSITGNRELARIMGILGYYAGFAGIGYKRTMGQGQVRFKTL